jgi:hypothetical protein
MRKTVLPASFASSLLACALAALEACSSGTTPPADAGTDGSASLDGAADGAWDGGDLPGGPPEVNAPIQALVNGQLRTFGDPRASTSKDISDGGSGAVSVLIMGSYLTTGISIANLDDTQLTPACPGGVVIALTIGSGINRTEWGGRLGAQSCSVQVTDYGRAKGSRVAGTFSAELELTRGSSPIQHLSVTQGTFDVKQLADPPP